MADNGDGPAIRLRDVRKRFPGAAEDAVGGLSLDVPRGEVVMFVGPSGCGKTTTLKMVNRLVEPTAGTIEVEGVDVTSKPAHELRLGIGYVIQQIGLFPHRTIAQNIETVPELLGWDSSRRSERTGELLDQMHLDHTLADRFPSELSGGQRQRVGVARALAADPPVMLMDEPFGAVDPLVRGNLQELLNELQATEPRTICFVTHDIDEAMELGDRVAVLNVGGVLEQYAPPAELLASPANDFVTAFLGRERGLRQLGLRSVADLSIPPGPIVAESDDASRAREVMTEEETEWVVVVDDEGTLRGWADAEQLHGATSVGDVDARPFAVEVQADASLREALDAIVSTRHMVAVVKDGDRYVGFLDITDVSDGLRT